MKKRFWAACAVLAAGSVQAAGADWQGPYVGVQLGNAWSDSKVSSDFQGGTFVIPPMRPLTGLRSGPLLKESLKASGFVGGLYAGYNIDLGGNLLAGLETDFSWGTVDKQTGYKSFDFSTLGGAGFMNARFNIQQKWSGATRIRLAYAMDKTLPYIAAGLAYAKVESHADAYLSATPGGPPAIFPPLNIPSPQYNFNNSSTFTGWTLGAGADYAMTESLLLRLEYRYADYGKKTYHHIVPGGGTSAVNYTVDHATHDVRLGLAYRF